MFNGSPRRFNVQVLSASNRVRVANLREPTLNNELVAFHLLPTWTFHRLSQRAHPAWHAILSLDVKVARVASTSSS